MSGFLPRVFYDRNDHESANQTMPDRSAAASTLRLQRRYRSLIDFEHCFVEMCLYLRYIIEHERDPNTKRTKKYQAAQRSLYPEFGAIGMNRTVYSCNLPTLEIAAYYWMAANDISPDILSSIDDRRACFARALYESQRGNNNLGYSYTSRNSAQIDFIDNGTNVDSTICAKGVNVKFAETFVGMHPDVDLVTDLQTRIFDLVKGFVAKYCYSIGITWEQLLPSDNELLRVNLNFDQIISSANKEHIRSSIINILGLFHTSRCGLMAAAELSYLNNVLDFLENLEFTVPQARSAVTKTKEQQNIDFQSYINKLICEVDNALHQANHMPSVTNHNNPMQFLFPGNNQNTRFNYQVAAQTLRGELPQPSVQSDILTNEGFRTFMVVGDGIVESVATYRNYTQFNIPNPNRVWTSEVIERRRAKYERLNY